MLASIVQPEPCYLPTTPEIKRGNMLNHHDKLTIRMIEQQMQVLHQRKASDAEMLETLSDFVPDVKYILSAGGIKEIKLCLKENRFFAYFVSLVQGKKPRSVNV